MAIKFLSDEWLSEVENRLNSHEGFQAAAKGQAAKLQQEVTGTPEGDISYGFILEDGKVQLVRGEVEGPEATITQDYDTAAALSKGELNGQAAFMSGKLKIGGNLMKMMTLQGVLTQMPAALGDMDVEY
ncbi:MAG TPA: SCP2 sterol-binding domain-containing protein [Actinomycetota bacterium]|nr:SCP2 sterol-binding domain-containing protein [Actinomycetota bacterium]